MNTTATNSLSRNWWMVALRGVLSIIFGVLLFVAPGISLQTLIAILAAWLIIDGVSNIVTSIQHLRQHRHGWMTLIEGVISVIAGIGAFVLPGLTALTLLYLIAFWAIATGIIEIIAAFQLRRVIENELWLGLGGVISIVVGVLLVANPGAGILSVLWLIGAYAIVFGVVLIAWSLRLRSHDSTSPLTQATPIPR
jgi:uncharacterized membrane protein HdeD (DUF308 family)